jgi:Zn-dependent peptidase ImmA (M78 family)
MSLSQEWNRLDDEVKERIQIHQQTFPIKIGNIAKELGLIVKASTLDAGISGEIRKTEESYLIKVNRHDVKERQRFTVAHEIAHFLLHRNEIGDGLVDDVMYRSKLSDSLEAEANRLAADLILPWDSFHSLFSKMNHPKLEQKIEEVAKITEVSTTVIKIRIGKF